jgi:hypothetical protein
MRKSDLKKTHSSKKPSYSHLLTSFKRALSVIGTESRSTLTSMISRKRLSDTFLTYDEIRKMNAELLKTERLKGEGIQLIREKTRCI